MLQNLAAIATILALLVSLGTLAFSARRYLVIREREQEKERFARFHEMLKTVSKVSDSDGPLKLVSQIAYINELARYPEYSSITEQSLNLLRSEWSEKEPEKIKRALVYAIDEVLATLQARK